MRRLLLGSVAVSLCLLLSVTAVADSLEAASEQADEPPPSVMVKGLIGHPQQRNLSCESRSTTDLAAYWGADFTEHTFFRRLPKSDNPHRGFVGDVDAPAGSMPPVGYGVYAEPIAATLRSFGLDAEAHRGMMLTTLKGELAAQRPVIIWATYSMQLPGIQTWVSSDGMESTVVRWQHTFIVVGYDESSVYLVDAYDGVVKTFSQEAFVAAWDQLDRMAVTVAGPLVDAVERTWRALEVDGRCQFLVDGRWSIGPR